MAEKTKNEEILWKRFLRGDHEARSLLIEKYTPLVKYVAGRIKMVVPPQVEFDDLVSYGVFGLIQALERFDPRKGVKFSAYAKFRIRGAILDGLRSQDWVSRTGREKAGRLKKAYQRLQQELGREPEDAELAAELNLNMEEYYQFLLDANIPELTSLDVLVDPDSNTQKIELIKDENQGPDQVFHLKEMKAILAEAIDRLKEQEKLVVALYYYEELTQVEIAQVLDLSPARVSQIHSKAILRLRGMLSRKKAVFL